MWRGHQSLFLTPSSCSVAAMMLRSLPKSCQVLRSIQVFTISVTGGGAFELRHSGDRSCGIPDEDTIVMTGGFGHQYVTRWVGWWTQFKRQTRTYHTIMAQHHWNIYVKTSSTLLQVQSKWFRWGTSSAARNQVEPRLRCSPFHQGEISYLQCWHFCRHLSLLGASMDPASCLLWSPSYREHQLGLPIPPFQDLWEVHLPQL